MKKRFAASAMILAMSAATVLSPLTAFAEAEEQELNIAIFQGGYGDAYWNQMVELFEESHEGVKVPSAGWLWTGTPRTGCRIPDLPFRDCGRLSGR